MSFVACRHNGLYRYQLLTCLPTSFLTLRCLPPYLPSTPELRMPPVHIWRIFVNLTNSVLGQHTGRRQPGLRFDRSSLNEIFRGSPCSKSNFLTSIGLFYDAMLTEQ